VYDKNYQNAQTEFNKNDKDIIDLQSQMKNLEGDIVKSFPTSLSRNTLTALISNQQTGIMRKMEDLMSYKNMAKDQMDRIERQNKEEFTYKVNKEKETVSMLMDNGAMGLSATSTADIDAMVSSGQMTKATGEVIKKQQMGMLQKTLQSM
jgi:hypothetical protein